MTKAQVALTLLLITSAAFLFTSSLHKGVSRSKRAAFHGLKQERLPIMVYNHHLLIDTTQLSENQEFVEKIRLSIQSKCRLSPTYLSASQQYETLLVFEHMTIDQITVSQNDAVEGKDFSNIEEMSGKLVYKAIIGEEIGDIVSLYRNSGEDTKMIDTVVKDILKQSFASIQRQGFSLSQSEGDQEINYGVTFDETPIDLGVVEVEMNVEETEDEITVEKFYTDDDLVEFNFDMGGEIPQVIFEETKVISKELGLVISSETAYSFSLNNNFENLGQQQGEGADDEMVQVELLGSMAAELTATLELEDIHFDDQFINYIPNFTYLVDLTANSGSFWAHQEEEARPEEESNENLQTPNPLSQAAIYENNYKVFEKQVFGNSFGLNVNYKNLQDKSNVLATIYLNSRTIFTLVNFSYQHCPGTFTNKNEVYTLRLFKVSYPILYIITVNVQASLIIRYGWNWTKTSLAKPNGCGIQFVPYFKPGFDAAGDASLLIVKGGIYASGTVANSELSFNIESWGAIPFSSGNVGLSVSIIPFEFQIGAYYRWYKCSWFFNCSWGNRNEVPIINERIGGKNTYTIFNKSW